MPPLAEPPVDPTEQVATEALFFDEGAAGAAMPPAAAMPAGAPAGVVAPAVAPSVPPQPRRQRMAIPPGVLIGLVGAACFGLASAFFIFFQLPAQEPVANLTPEETAAEETTPATPDMVLDNPDDAPPPETEESAGTENAAEEPGSSSDRSTRRRAAAPTEMTQGKQLSAEERALMERFGEESSTAMINVSNRRGSDNRNAGPGLTQEQLARVVQRNKPTLQRCYSTATRGMSEAPTIRMDVSITVGGSGTVQRVRARGQDLSNLKSCIEGTVRRWRFPRAGNSTETVFPVVFAGS